jgi:hypothetical protein
MVDLAIEIACIRMDAEKYYKNGAEDGTIPAKLEGALDDRDPKMPRIDQRPADGWNTWFRRAKSRSQSFAGHFS